MSVNKLSGAQRRKLTKQKQEKELLIAKKIPRIENFFVHHETTTQASSSVAIEHSDEVNIDPIIKYISCITALLQFLFPHSPDFSNYRIPMYNVLSEIKKRKNKLTKSRIQQLL